MKIDNFDLIGKRVIMMPIVKYNSDSFYIVRIYKCDSEGRVNLYSQTPFKEYYVSNSKNLNDIKDEVIEICDKLNCRALISPNARSAHHINGVFLKKLTNELVDNGRLAVKPWVTFEKSMNNHHHYSSRRYTVMVSSDIDYKKVVDAINRFPCQNRLKKSCVTDTENPSMNFIRRVESDSMYVYDNAICVVPKNERGYDVLVYNEKEYDCTDLERHINNMLNNPTPYIICSEDDWLTLYCNC